MNDDRDKDKDYQIMELKQKISYYEPFKQKYEDLKEDWKYIKSLLDKEFTERTRLKKENEQLRNNIEQLNLADDIASHTSCDKLKKENKQLQEEKKWLKHQLEKLKKFEEWKDE